jgi:general stress protein 26
MINPAPYPPIHGAAVETIAQLLEHERLMSVATNRADRWPQVTTVGYVNEGLNLYFVTGRKSQKLANLQADPRVSIAIHSSIEVGGAVGVSMAARGAEVGDPAEVERLNRLMFTRWPQVSVYCPATSSIAIVRLKPELICAISASAGRSKTECFSLGDAAANPDGVSAEARLF